MRRREDMAAVRAAEGGVRGSRAWWRRAPFGWRLAAWFLMLFGLPWLAGCGFMLFGLLWLLGVRL